MLPGGEDRAGTDVNRLLLVRLRGGGVGVGHTTRINCAYITCKSCSVRAAGVSDTDDRDRGSLRRALLLVTVIIAVLMILDDPLPYCRLRVERFAVLVVDPLGGRPANLWPCLRTASGAVVPGHVLVGEAWQAQIKSAVS